MCNVDNEVDETVSQPSGDVITEDQLGQQDIFNPNQDTIGPIKDTLILHGGLSVSFSEESTIEQIEDFEDALDQKDINMVPILNPYCLKDKVCNGLYSRALFMPKGMVVTGAMHKKPYIDIMISGDVTVKSYLHDGSIEDSERFKGFNYFNGVVGRKRVLYMHEDTLWITVDHTNVTNSKDALDDISCRKMSEFKMAMKELTA